MEGHSAGQGRRLAEGVDCAVLPSAAADEKTSDEDACMDGAGMCGRITRGALRTRDVSDALLDRLQSASMPRRYSTSSRETMGFSIRGSWEYAGGMLSAS